MRQIVFLRQIDIPLKKQIQDLIRHLGYDFTIFGDLEKHIGEDVLECSINGFQIDFIVLFDGANIVLSVTELQWIKPDLRNQDTAISFVCAKDLPTSVCIGLILVALIDLSNALVYDIDNKMKYTREILITETLEFLSELDKQTITLSQEREKQTKISNKKNSTFRSRLKNIFQ
ncbi:hypothetical protein [Flavobacterium sp. FlaQc-48]|uniref:hypothetical protein n=1 Tax=Flavobacterium sp. FlaQc-48 TaxID=3374181 RepID=UPI003756DA9F